MADGATGARGAAEVSLGGATVVQGCCGLEGG